LFESAVSSFCLWLFVTTLYVQDTLANTVVLFLYYRL